MPARAAMEQLCDDVDDLQASKVRYLRTVDRVIRDGRVSEEERAELAIARAEMKARFRIVSRRTQRVATGNRILRFLANTGEITPKAERLFRELTADQARVDALPDWTDDGPDDGAPQLKAA